MHLNGLARSLNSSPTVSYTVNAVRSSTEIGVEKDIRRERLQQSWVEASRRAHKHQHKEGGATIEMDRYSPMVLGYPYRNPLYAPYMADPSSSIGPYPSNPSWLNKTGGYGDCATGTCANMIAAGECAAKNGAQDYGSFFDELGKLVEYLESSC